MYPRFFGGGDSKFKSEITSFVSSLRQLESLPEIALKVIEVAGNDRSDRRQISRLIETDAALMSRVLKVANSAWLGSPGRIDSLDRATAILGLDMVRNIALSVLVSHLLFRQQDSNGLRIRDLWHHSLACAVAAAELAGRTGFAQPSAAFVAGLLHDLGKIVLFKWNKDLYSQLLKLVQTKRLSLSTGELEVFGITHAEVGRLLLEDWNFPKNLAEAIDKHHASRTAMGPISQLSVIVECANCLCHLKRFGFSGHSQPELPLHEIEAVSGLSPDELNGIAVEVVKRFDEVAALFSAGESTPELYLSAVSRANQELSDMYRLVVERTRERELAEKELREKEEQLNRSQRLEAVGQLAGGIAHDFNNFLTVIMGFGDLLREGLTPESPLRPHVDTIMSVAERAATLTRQLLAFSRRQTLKPKVLNLNMVITDVNRLLVRLIGENIKLNLVLDPGLRPVRVDPGGIEQVIMNLAVNARDAMLAAGSLTIATGNLEVPTEVESPLGRLAPGSYVTLEFKDTGHGMSRETQERIFEPFFTTKKTGTGMGLATVYGIVKQSGGHIAVESEVGRGTVFRIYLQPVDQAVEPEPMRPIVDFFENGIETILVAEDEKEILELVEKILRHVGYTVLTARNGAEAIEIADQFDGPIHLLVTDAVMPVINGRELVERLRPGRPNMKVLFMSGYTAAGMLHRAVSGQDVAFIAKPFTPQEFVKKVQDVLTGQ